MRGPHRIALVSSAVVTFVVGGVVLWFFLAFVHGQSWTDRPGGQWDIDYVRFPGSQIPGGDLYYEKLGHRAHVARFVHQYRYCGDDCIAYGGSVNGAEMYFFACGQRESVAIEPGSRTTWELDDDSLRQEGMDSNATAFESGTRRIAVADLKRLAVKMPIRPMPE